jgi:hypothetical protein
MESPVDRDIADRVRHLLIELKDGIAATAVGLFDDDRGRMYQSSEASPAAFWEAFRGMGCLQNWGEWYSSLRGAKRLVARCSCGAEHAVHGFLLHERWVVLVVTQGELMHGADAVMSYAVRVLGRWLPSVRAGTSPPTGGSGSGGGGESARLCIPLWWVVRS